MSGREETRGREGTAVAGRTDHGDAGSASVFSVSAVVGVAVLAAAALAGTQALAERSRVAGAADASALAAADAGATITVVTDACAGSTPDHHRAAMDVMSLYPPQITLATTDEVLQAGTR